MDYGKVKILLRSETASERGHARIAGMSPSGFKTMMEKKTMTVETLERIAKHFNKPLSYFSDSIIKVDLANEPGIAISNCPECIEKQKKIDQLNEKLSLIQEKYTLCLEEQLGKKGNPTESSAS